MNEENNTNGLQEAVQFTLNGVSVTADRVEPNEPDIEISDEV